MRRHRPLHALIAVGILLTPTARAPAQADPGVEIEDRIDVVQVDRRILAVSAERGKVLEVGLRLAERVVASRSQGLIGVVTTNQRLLGATNRSGSWQAVELRRSETGEEPIHVSDRLALVPMPTRLMGLAGGTGIWAELELQPGENPIRVHVESRVGLCLTPRRAIALSAGGGGFVQRLLTPKETIESMSLKESSITLTTPYRVLLYQDGSDRWTELRRSGFRDSSKR
jgi:hypothetical protein